MARISFTAMVAEINGKLAGSVFQYSYGGFQLHTRVSPRNLQTQYQQLRRQNFGFIAASWRSLTLLQRETWIDAAVTEPEAFNLFVKSNINLILVGESMITDYVPTSVPDEIPLIITELTPASFKVMATGAITTVPTDTALLFFSTYQKDPTKIFTNPSEYSPIQVFPAGSDLSTPASVIAAFNARYGLLIQEKRLCIKSALVDITNGNRGAEPWSCATSEEMPKFVKINTNISQATTSGTGSTIVDDYTLPGNTLIANGDILTANYAGTSTSLLGTGSIDWSFNGTATGLITTLGSASWWVTARIQRISATSASWTVTLFVNEVAITQRTFVDVAANWSTDIVIRFTLRAPTSGVITLTQADINKELL